MGSEGWRKECNKFPVKCDLLFGLSLLPSLTTTLPFPFSFSFFVNYRSGQSQSGFRSVDGGGSSCLLPCFFCALMCVELDPTASPLPLMWAENGIMASWRGAKKGRKGEIGKGSSALGLYKIVLKGKIKPTQDANYKKNQR